MLTDKQSIFLCIIVVVGFVVSGIFNILDEIYITIPIITIFLIIIINLFVTKRVREVEEEQDTIKQKED
jgi:Sec-independent protein secretion pathway component TatC